MSDRGHAPAPTWLERLVDVRPHELAAVGWSWLFFFSVLSAYYVIRPIRDEMGVAGGVENLPWLFAGSLTGMLLLNPPFSWLVARMPRPRFVSFGYRFFALNLVGFFAALTWGDPSADLWTGRVLFVWTSVFNMFVVSIFWSVMADVFSAAQGKRLFGFIGAGGTLGGITGAAITSGAGRPARHGQPAARVGRAARGGGAVGAAPVHAAAPRRSRSRRRHRSHRRRPSAGRSGRACAAPSPIPTC